MESSVLSSADDKYLREVEAAEMIGLSRAWLQRARWAGQGPPYIKVGDGKSGAVLYRRSALCAWLEARTRTSTSDGAER